ncbi:hypothetical protein CTYAZ2_14400 [Comamonas testosteroni]|nr:hypothetical protein CTYAZ2_14400 [Comamonas testosteroni]
MATTTNSTTFQPAFKRVAQQGRHDDTFAAIAILTGKTLDSIMRQAETMGLPKIGPFHSYIDGDLIARICAAHGLVCSIWKECTKGYAELPEVAIAMVSYDADWEVGRCVVYHRNTSADGKTAQPYVVDPYPHTDSKLHVRMGTAALAELPPSWYIGVTQMNKTAGK